MTEPQRRIDATSLKALAHPLRVEIFDRLTMYGPATASALAEALGESSGSTSYHLRQLAKHGFIEEDSDRGSARERWWRVPRGGLELAAADLHDDPAALEMGVQVTRQWIEQRSRHADAFVRRGRAELGEEWFESSMLSSARAVLTAQELSVANEELQAALETILARYRGRDEVPGARPVTFQINGFPLVGVPEARS